MTTFGLNLASRPFLNRRPVRRFMVAGWILGGLLLGLNAYLYVRYRKDSTDLRARLGAVRDQIELESRNIVGLHAELDAPGLADQNTRVAFLNQRIAERTFPWSILFERVAETLPPGVRLLSLTPSFGWREADRRRLEPSEEREQKEEIVGLAIRGVARTDEELYEFIDAFFSHPAFERPRLYQESNQRNEVAFTVDVYYRARLQPVSPATGQVGEAAG